MTDRGSAASRFDPRFDPAFQPGYDPRNDPGADARAAKSAPRSSYVERTVSQPQPQPQPSVTGLTPPLPSAEQSSAAAEAAAPDTSDPPQKSAADDGSATEGANPFLVMLWIISALFIAAGIGLLQALPGYEQSLRTQSQSSGYLVIQAMLIASPILVALGLTTATAVLFVHAVRWRKRDRR